LERIEESAFYESGLKWIEIPSMVDFVCGSAFCARSLRSISVLADNQHFRIRGSFLEDVDCCTICRHFGSWSSIKIPSSVVVLGRCCFCACKSLESVTFESGSRLERIEESAFARSSSKSIRLPPSVTFIGRSAFVDTSVTRGIDDVMYQFQ
jgi:hypothetical protein